jgi:hypothetical protein
MTRIALRPRSVARVGVATLTLALVSLLVLGGCSARAAGLRLVERYRPNLYMSEPTPAPNAVNGLRAYSIAEEREDTVIFSRKPTGLVIGEVVTYAGEIRSGWAENRAVELAQVTREDGTDVFVTVSYLVPEGTLAAVVTPDAPLYDGPTLGSPSQFRMPRGTIVVVSAEYVHNGFVKVTTWDEQNGRGYPEIFMRPRDLTQDQRDVRSAVLLFKLARERDTDEQETLRAELDELTDTVFADEVGTALAE